MCLISLRWAPEHAVPLIIAANRDEYYQRSSLPAQCWLENPDIFGGKDLVAGGSWMGVNRKAGRLAAITNFREVTDKKFLKSRGLIVNDYLSSDQKSEKWLQLLLKNAEHYAGFNLLVGDQTGLYYLSNRDLVIRKLEPGLYGFSNGYWGDLWPKVDTLNAAVKEEIKKLGQQPQTDVEHSIPDFIAALHHQQRVPDKLLPDTGVGIAIERQRSSCFIIGESYGTRTSTVIMIENAGVMHWHEQHYTGFGKKSGYYFHRLDIPVFMALKNTLNRG